MARRRARAGQLHHVMLGDVGGPELNTIVVGGLDVTVPLEMDLDDDPLQDDEVRLLGQDGFFEQRVGASDPEAEALVEERLILYHFHDVPPGVYRVQVAVAGGWRDVMRGLVVQRAKESASLSTERRAKRLGGAAAETPADSDDDDS